MVVQLKNSWYRVTGANSLRAILLFSQDSIQLHKYNSNNIFKLMEQQKVWFISDELGTDQFVLISVTMNNKALEKYLA